MFSSSCNGIIFSFLVCLSSFHYMLASFHNLIAFLPSRSFLTPLFAYLVPSWYQFSCPACRSSVHYKLVSFHNENNFLVRECLSLFHYMYQLAACRIRRIFCPACLSSFHYMLLSCHYDNNFLPSNSYPFSYMPASFHDEIFLPRGSFLILSQFFILLSDQFSCSACHSSSHFMLVSLPYVSNFPVQHVFPHSITYVAVSAYGMEGTFLPNMFFCQSLKACLSPSWKCYANLRMFLYYSTLR